MIGPQQQSSRSHYSQGIGHVPDDTCLRPGQQGEYCQSARNHSRNIAPLTLARGPVRTKQG
jgi:hypothetical protein